MSQASNQNLQFSIDETVWLRSGYEAEEILSMALDPDITIEETTQYVAIKGALRLSGEYKPSQSDDQVERTDEVAYRVVDEISETEDGTALMEHNFPVDITIPASRVRSIEDVYVTVDSLDFSQPNRGCIQLQADISITGLINEELEALNRDQPEASSPEEEEAYNPLETVSYESYREPEEERDDQAEPQVEFSERVEAVPQLEATKRKEKAAHEAIPQSTFEESEDVEEVIPGAVFEEPEEPELTEAVRSEGPLSVEPDIPMDSNEVENGFKQFETPTTEVTISSKNKTQPVSSVPSAVPEPALANEPPSSKVVDEEPVLEAKPKIKDENALYLTKMLTQENERFTRVKMCIVQEGDNLETIAQRYEVPITNILRRNQLSTDQVDEGQVLYIPVKG